jgi:hypothetical protein
MAFNILREYIFHSTSFSHNIFAVFTSNISCITEGYLTVEGMRGDKNPEFPFEMRMIFFMDASGKYVK